MQLCDSCSTGGHRKPSKHYNSLPTPFSSITHSVTTHIIHLLLQLEVLCMLFEQSVCWGWICSPSPQSIKCYNYSRSKEVSNHDCVCHSPKPLYRCDSCFLGSLVLGVLGAHPCLHMLLPLPPQLFILTEEITS